MIKLLIWDWNGTLLDDTSYSLGCMNNLLQSHNKPPLSLENYRDIFTFPVMDYYIKAGFKFDEVPFETLSVEFISLYQSRIEQIRLKKDAVRALSWAEHSGMKQVLLSATELNNLILQVRPHNIEPYFDEIIGLDNIHAASKVELAVQWAEKRAISQSETLLIGDTVHDSEVAQALGVRCVLLADGHHSRARLEKTGVPVLDNLAAVEKHLMDKITFCDE